MQRSAVAAAILGVLGAGVLAVAAVRTGLYWVIDPGGDVLVTAAAVLLAAAAVVGSQALPVLRGRPFRSASALAIGAVLLGGAVRLVSVLPAERASDGVLVPYGPGAPPSISWTLLWWQVSGPAIATTASLLLLAAILAAVLGVARTVARLRTA